MDDEGLEPPKLSLFFGVELDGEGLQGLRVRQLEEKEALICGWLSDAVGCMVRSVGLRYKYRGKETQGAVIVREADVVRLKKGVRSLVGKGPIKKGGKPRRRKKYKGHTLKDELMRVVRGAEAKARREG